jgi:hypothetical protein
VCSQRDNMCLASEQSNLILDEEIWISKEIKYSENENNTLNIRYNNNRFCFININQFNYLFFEVKKKII